MKEIKLTLLENAENFLVHSLSQAVIAEENSENWKYAILHLVQAIELSLKELLKKQHPILIYKNIDKPNETVSLEFAVKRLLNISKINFNLDDIDTIKLASNFRNKIVHFEFSFKEDEIKPIYAKLIGFIQDLFFNHFNRSLDSIVNEDVWKEAIQIIDYSNELLKRAEQRFNDEEIHNRQIIVCNRCHQRSFVIQDRIDTCYVCGHTDEISICTGCEEYYFLDELRSSHEFDDDLYCEECLSNMLTNYYY